MKNDLPRGLLAFIGLCVTAFIVIVDYGWWPYLTGALQSSIGKGVVLSLCAIGVLVLADRWLQDWREAHREWWRKPPHIG